jgi:hypothetical protein
MHYAMMNPSNMNQTTRRKDLRNGQVKNGGLNDRTNGEPELRTYITKTSLASPHKTGDVHVTKLGRENKY